MTFSAHNIRTMAKGQVVHSSNTLLLLLVLTIATANPTEVFPMVVAIGDSFSAGTGAHQNLGSYDVPYGGYQMLHNVTYQLSAFEKRTNVGEICMYLLVQGWP
jgi:hypothetical protein